MVSISKLIEENPEFYKGRPPVSEQWTRVKSQAARHMRRIEVNPLFDLYRPNESEEIRNFRDSVRREITAEGSWRWITKVSRIFLENGITVNEESLSDFMVEWLTTGPFRINENILSVSEFMYQVVLPFMIEDPNGLLIPWPVIEPGSIIPPAAPIEEGGLPKNEPVDVVVDIVSSDNIVFLNEFIVSWNAGLWFIDQEKDDKKPYYKVADRNGFYIYIPVKNGNGEVEYHLYDWYIHNEGKIMVTAVGGVLTRYSYVDNISGSIDATYYESFLRPYFELSDEVTVSFSDNQAVRNQHAYPKLVMGQIPCNNANCKGGSIRILDETGKAISVENCGTCSGSGYIQNPGPYNVLVKESSMLDDKSTGPTLEYVAPPNAIVEHTYFVPWDLFTRAKRSIGLDILDDVGESGVAKTLRLDDLHDILRQTAANFFGIMSRYLGFIESLLVTDKNARTVPRVTMPSDLQYRPPEILKENAENALVSDRYQSTMSYYSRKYVNNSVLLQIYRFALEWAPILLNNQEEIKNNLAWGLYGDRELIQKDRAINIFQTIADRGEDKFLIMEKEKAFLEADKILQTFLPEPGINIQPEPGQPNS